MKFMLIVKATEETEAGVMPKQEVLEAMGKYNEELRPAFSSPVRACTRVRAARA